MKKILTFNELKILPISFWIPFQCVHLAKYFNYQTLTLGEKDFQRCSKYGQGVKSLRNKLSYIYKREVFRVRLVISGPRPLHARDGVVSVLVGGTGVTLSW